MRKISINLSSIIVFVLIIASCNNQELRVNNYSLGGSLKIGISPVKPTLKDEVLIIDTICDYELLERIKIIDFQIWYVRSFNSMMGMPCIQKVDTVSLGKLKDGSYTIFYLLIDKSDFVNDSIYKIETFHFVVSP